MLLTTTRRGVASSGCFRGASITKFKYDSFVEVSATGKSSGLGLDIGQKQGRFACAGRLRYTKAQAQTRRGGLMDRLDHVEKDILKGYVLHGSFHLGQPSDS